MTIGELEKAAGVTDRVAFWLPFAKLRGTVQRGRKDVSSGFQAGVDELHRLADARAERAGDRN